MQNKVMIMIGMFGSAWAMALMIASLAWTPCASGQEAPLASMAAPVCEKPPVIDGDLSDACWAKAVKADKFYIFGAGKTSSNVVARVVRDSAWLYVCFEIALPNPSLIQPTVYEHDGFISADDSVEIFLDPGTGGKDYYHYLLNAANSRAERKVHFTGIPQVDGTWDLPWRSATRITKTGWQAEIGIPLSILAGHEAAKATFNLCANRILVAGKEANGTGIGVTSKESLSWAPVRNGFHEPLSFGRLPGLDAGSITEPFLVTVQSATPGSYAADDKGGYYYEISGAVRSYTGKTGAVKLMVEDKPATGKGGSVSQEVKITKAGDFAFALKIPVSSFSGRVAGISLCDTATGEIIQNVTLRDMGALSLMRTESQHPCYTLEKEASIVCEIALPAPEMKGVSLVARDKEGKVLAEMTEVSKKTLIPVAMEKFRFGANAVMVELRGKSGELLDSQKVDIVKTDPSQAAFPLKDGDTWVMLGDSITAQHLHSNYLEAFCYARFPKWTFHFRNSGVGGSTVPSALERFDWDVAAWKPTVVSVELGMNDQGPFAVGAYITNMSRLTDQIVRIGARPVFFTASPINNGVATTSPAGASMPLNTFAKALRIFAAEQKAPFADQFHVLVNMWANNKPTENVSQLAEEIRKTLMTSNDVPGRELLTQWLEVWTKGGMQERGASLGGDPVHPGPVGQLTMCAALLKELKAPGLVSQATLDAAGKIVALTQCQVSNVVVGKSGELSFDRLDECLPMPIPNEARGALLVYPAIAELSQWMLTVTGLKAGRYQVSMDGIVVATVTAEDLAMGWNMGTLAQGEVAGQGLAILQLVSAKENLVSQWRGQSASQAKTPSDRWRASLDHMNKQVLEADVMIREAAQPKSHHFTIVPL